MSTILAQQSSGAQLLSVVGLLPAQYTLDFIILALLIHLDEISIRQILFSDSIKGLTVLYRKLIYLINNISAITRHINNIAHIAQRLSH